MREILFRGKRIDNGEWAYGYYFYDSFYNKAYITTGNYCMRISKEKPNQRIINAFEIGPNTVGRYIGKKDKNDNKIFEGDILEADVFKNLNRCKVIWTVEYKERFSQGNGYYFYDKNRRFNARATQSTIINTHAMVIGNIYDNTELLKE